MVPVRGQEQAAEAEVGAEVEVEHQSVAVVQELLVVFTGVVREL